MSKPNRGSTWQPGLSLITAPRPSSFLVGDSDWLDEARGVGLTLQFLVGDTDVILQAMADFDLDKICQPEVVERCADLSLHIESRDLDSLSRCMARFNNRAPMELRSHLKISVDSADGGALLVAEDWVSYVAAVPRVQLVPLVEDWFAKMAATHSAANRSGRSAYFGSNW